MREVPTRFRFEQSGQAIEHLWPGWGTEQFFPIIGRAAWLLKLRAHAEKYRDAGPTIITIVGGLPPRDLLWAKAGADEIDES